MKETEIFSKSVKVRDIPKGGIRTTQLLKNENISVLFDGTVSNNGDVIKIKGKIFVETQVECRRCLKIFKYTANEDLNINLFPIPTIVSSAAVRLTPEDLNNDFYSGDEINLRDYIINISSVLIPEYPLCSEDCSGDIQ